MNKTIIKTDKAPGAIGPYSQGVKINDMIFASGQIPLDPATGKLVAGGIEEQTIRVLENIKGFLSSQGLTLDNVIKTTVFMVDLGDFAKMNAIYAKYFVTDAPARTTVEVSKLPAGALIEIETISQI